MQRIQKNTPQVSHSCVALDGTGDYTSIQEAVDAVPVHNTQEVVIHIKEGVYEERVVISADRPHITLLGEGDTAKDTVITCGIWAGMIQENGDVTSTFRTATLNVYSNYFKAENISFVNSYDGSQSGGRQALAASVSGFHIEFTKCRFYGCQDTLYTKDGSQLYNECYIEGDVDFIFGGARAVFEKCEIHSINVKPEEEPLRGGYIVAPSTPISQKYGYLFTECVMTANNAENTVYLGRPWHPAADPNAIGSCVFMHCELGAHIREDGWKSHMGGYLSANARLYEFENRGPGAKEHEMRRQLTPEQAAEYTKERVLGCW